MDPTHIHEEAILLSTDIHEVEVTELSSMGEMKKKKTKSEWLPLQRVN